MTTMNISLPDSLKDFVDEQVNQRGYGTSSEFVRELIAKSRIACSCAASCWLEHRPKPWLEHSLDLMRQPPAEPPRFFHRLMNKTWTKLFEHKVLRTYSKQIFRVHTANSI